MRPAWFGTYFRELHYGSAVMPNQPPAPDWANWSNLTKATRYELVMLAHNLDPEMFGTWPALDP
jgi:hypothetical protein